MGGDCASAQSPFFLGDHVTHFKDDDIQFKR